MKLCKSLQILRICSLLTLIAPSIAHAFGLNDVKLDGLEADYYATAKYELQQGGTIYRLAAISAEPGDRVGDVVYWDGPIVPEASDVITILLKDEKVRYLYLNGPGGIVRFALELGKLVRSRGITTVMQAGDHCYSACALLFLGGKQRIIPSSTMTEPELAFHSPYYAMEAGNIPVDRKSLVGKQTCKYVAEMLQEYRDGDQVCSEIFATKGKITYSISILLHNGIATSTFELWRNAAAKDLFPSDHLLPSEQHYYLCSTASRYAQLRNPYKLVDEITDQASKQDGWTCQQAAEKACAGAVLPARYKLIDLAVSLSIPEKCPL